MLDFLMISTRSTKRGVVEIYPRFKICKSKDLMIRGGDFYAIWDEERGLWSTSEDDVIRIIDNELDIFVKEHKGQIDDHISVLYMWDSDSGSIDRWHKYCQKQQRDNYHHLDEKLIFSNQTPVKEDYVSKILPYSLEDGDVKAWHELINVLYSEEEKHKIEWAIGAIVTGDSKWIQKFLVFYGPPGSGKSTVIQIIQKLFEGYYCVFDSKALASGNAFALEPFKANPLVAIQHDGDLSRIEDNTRLNSLVSHEKMQVNEKHKNLYAMKFISFLIMGTNKYVKITDSKSGILRRLIDVHPTGKKVSASKYNNLMKQIDFELGHIAAYCRDVYLQDPDCYNDYRPTLMMSESNDFYNFIVDAFSVFKKNDGVTLKQAYDMYKIFCEESKVTTVMPKRIFKSELMNYFEHYEDRINIKGEWIKNYFYGFKTDILKTGKVVNVVDEPEETSSWLDFKVQPSNLDNYCADCFAQYANSKDLPVQEWDKVTTKLKDLDTSKTHYLRVPEHLIVIDFDLKDENGKKSFERNRKAAENFPQTYGELSKSGEGIHLQYIYNGDVTKISRIYAEDIEIKVYTGKSSLRRKLTKCNDLPIRTITGGLPEKKERKKEKVDMNNLEGVEFNRYLINLIHKNLHKEIHGATKPSVDFIYKILEDAYESGKAYDVTKLKPLIIQFAASSTNQSDYCLSLIPKMHFQSEEGTEDMYKILDEDSKPIIFFDMEVFPNVIFLNYKLLGKKTMYRLINPTPNDIEKIVTKYRLVGFNNRKYDNHMLYAIMLGYSPYEVFQLSQKIIKYKDGFFGDAYNLSYTDIYDYASIKQSLKKWEITLGLHHMELGLPWEEPVDESLWEKVSKYCDNDVISTEAVWDATQGDFLARQILVEMLDILQGIKCTVNDTTNTISTKIIFGNEKHPTLNYVDLSQEFPGYRFEKIFNEQTRKYERHNWYRGDDLGFGGWVYADPGMFGKTICLDVAGMHPESAIQMNLFGNYTQNFKDIRDLRLLIKHKDFEAAKKLFGGKLSKYLEDESKAKQLSGALKIVVNSVYGLTSAAFDNPFKDSRNENNIVALRGALMMRTLQDEVTNLGYKVVHIKTDSIKIADPDEYIINFVIEFGKRYGYTFETEANYDRICLVNDSVYIAKYEDKHEYELSTGEKILTEWTATGAQFAVPYVFKKCFCHEPITFPDLCETKEVKSAIYLDMDEDVYFKESYEIEIGIREKIQEILTNHPDDPKYDKKLLKLREELDEKLADIDTEQLKKDIHKYRFIGRVGLFCPIKKGFGGGILLREQLNKDGSISMNAVTGTKGYRWLESEEVMEKNMQDSIDLSYYDILVNNAIETISEFGDYERFVSGDPLVSTPKVFNLEVRDEEIPF